MTSPVGGLFRANLQLMSAGSEIALLMSQAQRERLLRALFTEFYADQSNRDVVFDTNRIWSARLPAILKLFPDAKVIATVRNLAWMMDNIERLLRAAPLENTRLFGGDGEQASLHPRRDPDQAGPASRQRLPGPARRLLQRAFRLDAGDRVRASGKEAARGAAPALHLHQRALV